MLFSIRFWEVEQRQSLQKNDEHPRIFRRRFLGTEYIGGTRKQKRNFMTLFQESVKLIEILKEIQSDTGAPCPKMVAEESDVYLTFNLQNTDTGIVLFRFKEYNQFKFGSPNDETINGHIYYQFGLKPYSIFEVENSD
jgi:hypothetical protein